MRLSGSFKEILGFYNPNFNERLFFMNMDRLAHWASKGVSFNKTVGKYILKFLCQARI